ncbi:MAG: hypothetical protein ACI87E_004335 [Mariniblastus sp.]|jgi:hypothetical protein
MVELTGLYLGVLAPVCQVSLEERTFAGRGEFHNGRFLVAGRSGDLD